MDQKSGKKDVAHVFFSYAEHEPYEQPLVCECADTIGQTVLLAKFLLDRRIRFLASPF